MHGRACLRAMSEDSFPTEPPTRPNNDEHRAQRMLQRWARLSPERKRAVEQLLDDSEHEHINENSD